MEINILGRKIPVLFVSDKELSHVAKDGDCWGCYVDNKIYVSSSASYDRAKNTITHEAIHAVFDITGITHLITEEQEEAICNALECSDALFYSPDLMKYFLQNEEQI